MAYVSFNKSLTPTQIEALTGAVAGKLYFANDNSGIYIIGTDKIAHKVADHFQIKIVDASLTVGSIIQYIGSDIAASGLYSGHFYRVEQDGWDEIEVQDVSGKEDKSNKVTSISSKNTNAQYPSAKAVYESLQYLTTAPTSDNTSGMVKFVFLDTIPAQEYAGYIYFIKEN